MATLAERPQTLLLPSLAALVLPALLWGGALVGEHGFGLAPCEMCYWQRWPHQAAIVLAMFSVGFAGRPASRIFLWLAVAAIALSGVIGVYHAGVERDLWEGLSRCATMTPGGFDMMATDIAPIVRCDEAQWRFLGLSLAEYNAILSLGGAALIAWAIGRVEARR